MSGLDGASIFLLILMGIIILMYVVIPTLYQCWKKTREKHA